MGRRGNDKVTKTDAAVMGTLVGGVVAGGIAGASLLPNPPDLDKTPEEIATARVAAEPDADNLSPADVAVRVAIEKAKAERDRRNYEYKEVGSIGAGLLAGGAAAAGAVTAVEALVRRRRRKSGETEQDSSAEPSR